MKLIIISDLHGQSRTLRYLENILVKEKPEGVIISGDITNRDDIGFLVELFAILKKNNVAGFMIWGNSDGIRSREMIDSSGYSIHLTNRTIAGFNLYGIAYSSEPVVPDSLKISGSILVTHRPPLARLLKNKFVNSPKFHISGHIHSAAYLKHFPSTIQIQVPTLQDGRYVVFDPKKQKVQFLLI